MANLWWHLNTTVITSASISWKAANTKGNMKRGPIRAGLNAVFRMVEHSWMFWHPVSMETVLRSLTGRAVVTL